MRTIHYRLLLAGIVFVTFVRVCANDFVAWDDPNTIYQNPHLNPPTARGILRYWSPRNPAAGLWVPVTYTAWGLVALVARLQTSDPQGITLNPQMFHAVSLFVHIATTLIAFELLRRITKSNLGAIFGAAIFALHPMQVEAVAWASGLKDLLCGFFSLAALWNYLDFAETKRKRSLIFGLALLALGMLSKPTAVVVPVCGIVIDRLVLQRKWRDIAKSAAPFIVLAIPCLIWTKIFQTGEGIPSIGLAWRPLLAMDSLAFYIAKLFWPFNLALDYGRRPPVTLEQGKLLWTWLLPAGVAIGFFAYRKRAPILVAGALLFVAGVSPVLGLSRTMFQMFSTVADHYLYISMIGPALILAWLIARTHSVTPRVIATAALALCAVLSFIQLGRWRDDLTFWNHNIAANPDSVISFTHRGGTWYRLSREAGRRGDSVHAREYTLRAEADLRTAIDMNPKFPWAYVFLGEMLTDMGRGEEAKEWLKKMPLRSKAGQQ